MSENNDTSSEASQHRPVSYEFLPYVRQGYQPSRTFDMAKSGSRLDEPLAGRSTVGVKLNLEGRRKDGSGWEDLAVRYDEADDSFSKLDRQDDAGRLGKELNDTDDWVDISEDEIAEVDVDIRMFGPGDVSGIDREQVVRVHPEPGTQRMPSNYFPHVEFMRPDLPWLFSPERADGEGRARPWLALVIVERSDATVQAGGTAPLERLEVTQTQLPPQSELWAWAHTQVNHYPEQGRGEPPYHVDDQTAARLFTTPNADAVSRLICPRRLDEQTEYLAAIVPTFEPGRRAGLGQEPYPGEGTPTLGPAWDSESEDRTTLPIYYHWEFTSGSDEDFEALVRKLEPRDLSKDEYAVGVRRVDCSDPGPIGLQDTTADGLVEKMGGAMKAGDLTGRKRYPADKRTTLESILETPERYASRTNRAVSNALARRVESNNEFPLVTESTNGPNDVPIVNAPIYGRWHVMREGVPASGSRVDWVRQLNLDPRWRIAAGFGTSVLREHQDEYMRRAWQQFGSLRAANRDTKRREAGSGVSDNLRDRLERSGLGSDLRSQLDYGGRVDGRSITELHRRITAAARASEDGLVGRDLPGSGGDVGTGEDGLDGVGIDDVGPDLPDSEEEVGGPDRPDVAGSNTTVGANGTGTPAGAAGRRDLTTRSPTRRYENVTSTAFRQLTRAGGKLDAKADAASEATPKVTETSAAETQSSASETDVGASATDVGATDTGVGETTSEPLAGSVTTLTDLELGDSGREPGDSDELLRDGGEDPSDSGNGAAGPDREAVAETNADSAGTDEPADGTVEAKKPVVPEQADWRVDEDGDLLSLQEAFESVADDRRLLPKALLQLEATKRHCVTARQAVESALSTVDGTDAERRAAMFDSPSLRERCDAIRENTFDAVDRQFSKLLADPPEPLSDELTHPKKNELLSSIGDYHDQLLSAVKEAARIVDGEDHEPERLRTHLTEAKRAIEGMEAAIAVLWGYVDTGTYLLDDPVPVSEIGGAGPAPAATDERTTGADEPPAHQPMSGPAPSLSEPSGPDPELARAMDAQLGSAASMPAMDATVRAVAERRLDRQTRTTLFSATVTPTGKRMPALLDGTGWTVRSASTDVHPKLADRDKPLSRVMAAPAFDDPMYRKLKALDQEYLLPGVDDVPNNTIGAVVTNPPFIEAFMCGLNHEMGAELLYRRYPTDRRGTHFRQFWDYSTGASDESDESSGSGEDGESADNDGSDASSESDEEGNARYDIQQIHEWRQRLGENYPPSGSNAVGGEKVVLLVRGELLKMYPRTRIFAAKAIKRNPLKQRFRGENAAEAGVTLDIAEDMVGGEEDRIPLLEPLRQTMLEDIRRRENEGKPNPYVYTESELEDWGIRQPIFEGDMDPDVEFFGFDMGPSTAVGQPLDIGRPEFARDNLGWFFVFEERMGETRFGLDNASAADGGAIPDGIVHGAGSYESITAESREVGWSGLSWGHLVDVDGSATEAEIEGKLAEKSHVRITADRPWNGSKRPWRVEPSRDQRLDEHTAAEWGTNAAHMARITWQLPVRVAVHADDILPNTAASGGSKSAAPDGGRIVEDPTGRGQPGNGRANADRPADDRANGDQQPDDRASGTRPPDGRADANPPADDREGDR
jgi:hypothetical protein